MLSLLVLLVRLVAGGDCINFGQVHCLLEAKEGYQLLRSLLPDFPMVVHLLYPLVFLGPVVRRKGPVFVPAETLLVLSDALEYFVYLILVDALDLGRRTRFEDVYGCLYKELGELNFHVFIRERVHDLIDVLSSVSEDAYLVLSIRLS